MIAVILPSRGLANSRTLEDILKNVKGLEYRIFFSHRKPIPQCFEDPTQEALYHNTVKNPHNVTHLWFVEDDMSIPPRTLKTMLAMDKAVVTADYPVNKEGKGAVFYDGSGKAIFCGTGCLLVKAEVFSELREPYFRSDIKWNCKNLGGGRIKFSAISGENDGYGGHDINFCMQLNRVGIPIHVISRKLSQRKLLALGKQGSNNGQHSFEEWTTVKKDYTLKKILKWPIAPTGKLITVSTPTGLVNTSQEHANKLIEKGLAAALPQTACVIDYETTNSVDNS